jgi:hypothetical protein
MKTIRSFNRFIEQSLSQRIKYPGSLIRMLDRTLAFTSREIAYSAHNQGSPTLPFKESTVHLEKSINVDTMLYFKKVTVTNTTLNKELLSFKCFHL